jgi:hypothetical protein
MTDARNFLVVRETLATTEPPVANLLVVREVLATASPPVANLLVVRETLRSRTFGPTSVSDFVVTRETLLSVPRSADDGFVFIIW